MENHHKVIIIGSGPAGYTAAIYTSRALLSPLMFEGIEPGGQLMNTTDVENYPGFPEGVMGPDMMTLFKKQAERFGTEIVSQRVDKVDFSQTPHQVTVGDKTYTADSIIIATGASAKLLGLDAEKKFMGKGVSTCATCDGAFYREKEVAVVGGGDSAMEEALFLTRFARKVYVIHRRSQLRASQIMQDRAMKNEKIEFIWNTAVEDVLGDATGVTGLSLKNLETSEERSLSVHGMFVAIGHLPNTDIFKDQLALDEKGYIVTHQGTLTSKTGVFAAGDVQDSIYRQAITASGTGCMAAIDCERYLETLHK